MIEVLKAGGLGMLVGGVFALSRITPPSPDNLSGVFGIIGIYAGWMIVSTLIKAS
jgi:XapX domain-containing protein|tara:strand:- start:75 stop:239 length:165 start_codon:yes stop_codon:yes gene_type:complete